MERLQAPELFRAGRDQRYVAAPPFFESTLAGRRVGNMIVGGSASSSISYDSNVDAEPSGGDGDAVLATNLSLQASPILRRHALAFLGSVTATGVLPDVATSDVGLNLGAAGTLDLSRRSTLAGLLTYSRQTETLATAESLGQGTDSGAQTVDRIGGSAVYTRRYRRSSLAFGPGLTMVFDENDSNDNYYQPSLSGTYTYELTPRLGLGLSPSLAQTIYPERDSDGTDRSSRTAAASVGANYSPGRETVATLSVGYQLTDFADSSRGSSGGVIFGAGLSGRLGEWTTGSLQASRSFNPTTNVEDTGGATVTRAGGELQRVLGRRLSAFADLATNLIEYETIDRTDVLVSGGVGLVHAWSDTVDLVLRTGYSERFSDVPEGEFQAWTITAGVTARF
jgi:hypothetical protein